jgi:hypothetical protein
MIPRALAAVNKTHRPIDSWGAHPTTIDPVETHNHKSIGQTHIQSDSCKAVVTDAQRQFVCVCVELFFWLLCFTHTTADSERRYREVHLRKGSTTTLRTTRSTAASSRRCVCGVVGIGVGWVPGGCRVSRKKLTPRGKSSRRDLIIMPVLIDPCEGCEGKE